MSQALQALVDGFLKFYSENKHNPAVAAINEYLLSQALSARGYNNYSSKEESGELFFLGEILAKSNPKLCIDVGANVGEYSLEILKRTDAHVIAFEPVPLTFLALKSNLSQYADRTVVENLGVASEEGYLEINFNRDAMSHASFSTEVSGVGYLENGEVISVPVVTLDNYLDRSGIHNVDLVKIDVEGFEAEVFVGAARTLRVIRPRYIQIEFNWHQLFRNHTLNYFANQLDGYDVYQLIPGGWVKRDPKDPYSNIFMYSNFVFARVGDL